MEKEGQVKNSLASLLSCRSALWIHHPKKHRNSRAKTAPIAKSKRGHVFIWVAPHPCSNFLPFWDLAWLPPMQAMMPVALPPSRKQAPVMDIIFSGHSPLLASAWPLYKKCALAWALSQGKVSLISFVSNLVSAGLLLLCLLCSLLILAWQYLNSLALLQVSRCWLMIHTRPLYTLLFLSLV